MNELIIIGGGGHCRVVMEAVKNYQIAGFLDDNEEITQINGYPRLGKIEDIEKYRNTHLFHIAIGNNKIRRKIGAGIETVKIIHPTAYISESAWIGEGTFLGINAVINSNCRIGKNCIINTGTIVEHDCTVEDYVHLSYRNLIGSGTKIYENVFLDMNSVIERGKGVK